MFLTITPEAVQRPMAVVNLTFILALAGRLLEQDRLTREGRWADKQDARGTGLVGKTLGTIGFGRIAQETHRIARPLGMRHIAHDPYAIADCRGGGRCRADRSRDPAHASPISSSWRRR